jgi:hypothetical protein
MKTKQKQNTARFEARRYASPKKKIGIILHASRNHTHVQQIEYLKKPRLKQDKTDAVSATMKQKISIRILRGVRNSLKCNKTVRKNKATCHIRQGCKSAREAKANESA